MKKLRIGVIYGGRSSEHEVSLASAASVIANLDRSRYAPVPIRIDRDGRWTIADRPPSTMAASAVITQARREPPRAARSGREAYLVPHPGEETVLTIERAAGDPAAGRENAYVAGLGLDIVFPVLHGPYGEDGTVQGLLELANVPYAGSGVLASAVGMDKAMMKVCFAARGLPIVKHLVAGRGDWERDPEGVAARVGEGLGYPVFVKPANLGSSVGISKVGAPSALGPALALAGQYDRKVVIEAAVRAAREIECSVVGNDRPEASVPGEIVPSREFYDYEAKYLEESKTLVPAPLDPAQAAEVRRLAVEAFVAVEASGFARVDLLVSRETGEVVLNEINTIPGFTTISMFPKLWEATGLSYPALLDRIVELAFERHASKQALRTGRP